MSPRRVQPDDGETVGVAAMLATGATYRQLDYWTSSGHLHTAPRVGSPGRWRRWLASEVRIAEVMARLVAPEVGLPPAAAARVARAGGRCEVAPGVVVTVGGGTDRPAPRVTAEQVHDMIRDIFADVGGHSETSRRSVEDADTTTTGAL